MTRPIWPIGWQISPATDHKTTVIACLALGVDRDRLVDALATDFTAHVFRCGGCGREKPYLFGCACGPSTVRKVAR